MHGGCTAGIGGLLTIGSIGCREAHGGRGRGGAQEVALPHKAGVKASNSCNMVQDVLHSHGCLEGAGPPGRLMRRQVHSAHLEVKAHVGYVEALQPTSMQLHVSIPACGFSHRGDHCHGHSVHQIELTHF